MGLLKLVSSGVFGSGAQAFMCRISLQVCWKVIRSYCLEMAVSPLQQDYPGSDAECAIRSSTGIGVESHGNHSNLPHAGCQRCNHHDQLWSTLTNSDYNMIILDDIRQPSNTENCYPWKRKTSLHEHFATKHGDSKISILLYVWLSIAGFPYYRIFIQIAMPD